MLRWIQIALLLLIVSLIMGYCWPAYGKVNPNYNIPEDVYIEFTTCSGQVYIMATNWRVIHWDPIELWSKKEIQAAKKGAIEYYVNDARKCHVRLPEKQ